MYNFSFSYNVSDGVSYTSVVSATVFTDGKSYVDALGNAYFLPASINGTRVYTDLYTGVSLTSAIVQLAVVGSVANTGSGSGNSNRLYPQYPYFDRPGWSVLLSPATYVDNSTSLTNLFSWYVYRESQLQEAPTGQYPLQSLQYIALVSGTTPPIPYTLPAIIPPLPVSSSSTGVPVTSSGSSSVGSSSLGSSSTVLPGSSSSSGVSVSSSSSSGSVSVASSGSSSPAAPSTTSSISSSSGLAASSGSSSTGSPVVPSATSSSSSSAVAPPPSAAVTSSSSPSSSPSSSSAAPPPPALVTSASSSSSSSSSGAAPVASSSSSSGLSHGAIAGIVVGSVVGGLLLLLCCILLLLAATRRNKRDQPPVDSETSKQRPSDVVVSSEISQNSRNLPHPQQVEMITIA